MFEAKTCFKRYSELAEVISLNIQYILFTLEENNVHQCSKFVDPSTESNPHRFGPTTNNIHRRHRKEEKDPHLHT
jgi:hypothetical protein